MTYSVKKKEQPIHERYEEILKSKGIGRSEHIMAYIKRYVLAEERKNVSKQNRNEAMNLEDFYTTADNFYPLEYEIGFNRAYMTQNEIDEAEKTLYADIEAYKLSKHGNELCSTFYHSKEFKAMFILDNLLSSQRYNLNRWGYQTRRTKDEINKEYKLKAKKLHPDLGGSVSAMQELNRWRETELKGLT